MTNPDRRVTTQTVPENQKTDRLESEQQYDTEEQPKNGTGENSMSFTQETRTSAKGRSRDQRRTSRKPTQRFQAQAIDDFLL